MPRTKFEIGDYAKPMFIAQFPNVAIEHIGEVIDRSKERGCKDRILVEFPNATVWESEKYLETVTVSSGRMKQEKAMNWPCSADKPLYS